MSKVFNFAAIGVGLTVTAVGLAAETMRLFSEDLNND
tara:strand:- start:570 stop:680 length:111 start_codon:yes stop_codon:yes gene_type:complete